ncbi:MAG TPA: hypothetical protein VJR06_04035, partial [Nitrososphaerales archaeon]|nr:hypothetical protein [Nitrososphaerales archaeon]
MPGGEPVQAMPPDETRADLSARRVWRVAYSFTFILFACLNLIVLIEANELAFAAHQQPFDFYVLLRGSSQVFSSPSQVYVWQTS